MTDTLAMALSYLKDGYAVIPCQPGGKKPLLQSWKPYQSQRPTEQEVTGWWKQWPDANIAIITGRVSNLTVIDVDGQTGLDSIKQAALKLPTTRSIRTPHGHHLYYRYHSGFTTGAGFLPGLDVRSEGGYVIAPPSKADGQEYRVFKNNPIVPLTLSPDAFARQTNGHHAGAPESQPGWVSDALANGAPEKQRNDTAIRLAGYFHSKGLPDDIVATMLMDFASRCTPPMDEREIAAVVKSAARYPTKPAAIVIEDAPEMEVLGDTFRFRWPKHNLALLLEQLHEDKEGVHSELTLLAEDTPVRYLYGPVRYNLTASVQRTGVTKYLKDYDGLDAARLLQDVSRMAIAAFRKGEEAVYLSDVQAPAHPEWAIQKLLLAGHPNILFGMGGTSKSYIALAVMLTLQAGKDLGFGFKPSRAMRGLYLDWEFEAQDHHQRMAYLCGDDFEMAGLGIMYLRCTGSLYSSIAKIRKIIVEHQIEFVVVDSVAIACGGAPEMAENALRFFDALRTLKVTSLCVAHSTKAESNGYAFGSIFWHNAARNIWEVFKDQDEGDDGLRVMLKHRKSNVGPLQQSVGITLKFTPGRVQLTVGEADKTSPVFQPKLTTKEKIIAYLENYGPTPSDALMLKLQLTDDNFYQVMTRDRRADKPVFAVRMDGRKIVSVTLSDRFEEPN